MFEELSSMTEKQPAAHLKLFDKDMAHGDCSLEQEVRRHRSEIVQHHISAHNLVNLVYFAKNLLTSVEMARIQESKGTLCIHIRIGGDFLTMVKQMGDRDPCKRDAFMRTLGKLFHNLHIMKYALLQKKTDSNMKRKGGNNQKKGRGTAGQHQIPLPVSEDRLLADIDSYLHGKETHLGSGQSEPTRISASWASTKSDNPGTDVDFISDMYHEEIPLLESNSMDVLTETTLEAELTSCLPMSHNQPLNDTFRHDTEEMSGKNQIIWKKLTQTQISENNSNMHQPVKLGQVTNTGNPALYTFHGSGFQKGGFSQQVETCRPTFSLRNHRNHPGHNSMQLQPLDQEESLFSIPDKSSQDAARLQLVAVGGDTVELPVGETIQLMPYSSVGHTSNDSTLHRLNEGNRNGIHVQDNSCNSEMVKESENNSQKQLSLMEISGLSEACADQTPASANPQFPILTTSTRCYSRNEHIRQDIDSGKTFINL